MKLERATGPCDPRFDPHFVDGAGIRRAPLGFSIQGCPCRSLLTSAI